MKPRHLIGLVAVLSLLLAACGGGGGGGSSSTTSSSSSSQSASGGTSSDAVKIDNFKFTPATVTVAHGARVTVTNADSTAHTATADSGNSFDTGNIDPGSSKTITVAKAGRYAYHCTIHPFMHGTLVVK
jgi:plastocyanin